MDRNPPATASSGGRVSIGQPVARLEDERLLRGGSRYVSDLIAASKALRVKVLRSPHAHARILAVDATRARTLPGIVAALTADDLAGIGDLPCDWVPPGMEVVPQHPVLARDHVRYVGEPVAAVAAETASTAEEALGAITVAYGELPAVADQEAAIEDESPCLHEGVPRNIAYRHRRTAGDIDRAFAEAEVVVRRRITNNRVTAAPLEGRAVLSDFDTRAGRLTHHTSSQLPHAHARSLGECLGLPLHKLRLVAPDVGGGFGAKLGFYAEDVICAVLSMRTGRPCAWAEGRRESFLATTHGRDHIQYAELAAGRDGRIRGLRTRLIADIGAYALGMGPGVPAINAGLSVTGPYRIPNVDTEVIGVYTNRTPTGPYRGAGHPEATFLIERMVDDLARELARDPADVRRANFVLPAAMPYRLPTGLTLDSGDYAANMDAALALAGYANLRREQARLRREGRWLGIGLATFSEATGVRWRWPRSASAVPATRARVWWSMRTGGPPCSPVRRAPGRAMPRRSPRLRPVCSAWRSTTSKSWRATRRRSRSGPARSTRAAWRSAARPCTRRRARSWTRPRGLPPISCRGARATSSTRTASFDRWRGRP
jgi:carbon-monoxide dehydrogenase large subunit